MQRDDHFIIAFLIFENIEHYANNIHEIKKSRETYEKWVRRLKSPMRLVFAGMHR